MDDFSRVASADSLSDETPLVIVYRARRIAIYKLKGCFFAVEDVCPHMGAFVSNGFCKDGLVVCPWHNWEFDISTGQCVSNDSGACLQTFPVKVVGNDVFLPSRFPDDFDDEPEELEQLYS